MEIYVIVHSTPDNYFVSAFKDLDDAKDECKNIARRNSLINPSQLEIVEQNGTVKYTYDHINYVSIECVELM